MYMLSQLEFALKVALGDPLIQPGSLLLFVRVRTAYAQKIIVEVISSSLSANPATAIVIR